MNIATIAVAADVAIAITAAVITTAPTSYDDAKHTAPVMTVVAPVASIVLERVMAIVAELVLAPVVLIVKAETAEYLLPQIEGNTTPTAAATKMTSSSLAQSQVWLSSTLAHRQRRAWHLLREERVQKWPGCPIRSQTA